ncbi:hypothetical protein BDP27DRAFT_1323252 [Rhodocollybia butyracea]|uniref:Uncharacterized protein n=1 Tax=Rhodocollybia butyracea TaxID=206335 RepID=A0A9P5PWS5_9AGAR|nr:hypothetical protein BDP27DRAFT_1323252 [Rhodocollybia butyracea]
MRFQSLLPFVTMTLALAGYGVPVIDPIYARTDVIGSSAIDARSITGSEFDSSNRRSILTAVGKVGAKAVEGLTDKHEEKPKGHDHGHHDIAKQAIQTTGEVLSSILRRSILTAVGKAGGKAVEGLTEKPKGHEHGHHDLAKQAIQTTGEVLSIALNGGTGN